jgi:hypothetical protein
VTDGELGQALELLWEPFANAPPAKRERAFDMVSAALDEQADEPELTQLLAWMRVHLLGHEPAPEEDAEAAERLLDAAG